jgi:hypothetical protein
MRLNYNWSRWSALVVEPEAAWELNEKNSQVQAKSFEKSLVPKVIEVVCTGYGIHLHHTIPRLGIRSLCMKPKFHQNPTIPRERSTPPEAPAHDPNPNAPLEGSRPTFENFNSLYSEPALGASKPSTSYQRLPACTEQSKDGWCSLVMVAGSLSFQPQSRSARFA